MIAGDRTYAPLPILRTVPRSLNSCCVAVAFGRGAGGEGVLLLDMVDVEASSGVGSVGDSIGERSASSQEIEGET